MEELSDVGLHKKFIHYNLPSLPVTETTRNIMFNKIKARYSSDSNKQSNVNPEAHVKDYSMRDIIHKRAEMDTLANARFVKDYGVNKRIGYAEINQNQIMARQNICSQKSGYTDNSPLSPTRKYRMENLENSLTASSSSPYRPSTSKNQKMAVSNFEVVKRLLRLRNTTLFNGNSPTKQKNIVNANRSMGLQQNNFNVTQKHNNYVFLRTFIKKSTSCLNGEQQNRPLFISYALISIFLMFLAVVACIYIFIISKSFLSRETIVQDHLCSEIGMITTFKGYFHLCIEEKKLANIHALNADLAELLKKNAKRYKCIDNIQHVQVGGFNLTHLINKKEVEVSTQKLITNLNYPMHIVKCNPQLDEGSAGKTQSSDNRGEKLGQYQINTFILLKPHVSLMMSLKYKLQRSFFIIGTGTLIFAIALSGYAALKYVQGRNLDRAIAIENLTADIINELKYRASVSDGKDAEIAVNDLRDKILPIDKRRLLLKKWNEALRNLENTDNRVQFCMSICNSEEYCTIKWIDNIQTNNCNQTGTKKWQSPAFKNVNKIAHPPTECLKIRNMFDSTETSNSNLKREIVQAISAKVGNNCNICDIQLDSQSCCVYVRCASEKDAGIIHNELNGWWFDKRLVSIKFLRLQRYLSRFPASSANSSTS